MIDPLSALTGWAGALVAGLAGLVLGRLLTTSVALSLGERSRGARLIELLAVATAVGLWWWEIAAGRLTPLSADGSLFESPPVILLARFASHLLFFTLLAAATWIDMRYRIIPDWITVTGVVLGLAAAALLPEPFLPVGWEQERSFAAPAILPDVLAAFGGLRSTPGPAWLGGAPHAGGLALAGIIFLAWWFFCTAPFLESERVGVMPPMLKEPRTLVLIAGVGGIVFAWFAGGQRFAALQSSLIGLAVAAGLVWGVREGASRAMGREAMGFGDVTLMAMIGAWLGWQPSILVFFMATFLGLAHGLLGLILHRDNELPYGPSLCLAAVLVVVVWRPLWVRVGAFFADPLLLAVVLVAVVVLTAVALWVWQWVRGAR
jgi:prepilin signal peptidase PulO-like enzyme (type II secretory pathway)